MRLVRFILKRLALAVLTLFTLFTLTFILTRAVPGDPLVKTKEIPEETRRNLEAKHGLDKPMLQQYGIALVNMMQGDLGESFRTVGREVNDIIAEQFPVSAAIGVTAVFFGTLIGLGLGITAALYRNSIIDRVAMFLCVSGIALPGFLFAYLFQYFLAVYPLTKLGFNSETWIRPAGWGEARDFILPSLSLSLFIIALVTRMMRSQMVEVSFSEYVKTAKAKGASTFRLLFLHQIRNAILPVVSILGPLIVTVLGGGLIIENIFGIPGLGRAFLSSIQNNDYNVIMGLTVFFGGFFVIVNLITDILYGLIDPRIRI
jgi:oligopeptide transport system permease protein